MKNAAEKFLIEWDDEDSADVDGMYVHPVIQAVVDGGKVKSVSVFNIARDFDEDVNRMEVHVKVELNGVVQEHIFIEHQELNDLRLYLRAELGGQQQLTDVETHFRQVLNDSVE